MTEFDLDRTPSAAAAASHGNETSHADMQSEASIEALESVPIESAEERVRRRAYELFLARGTTDGADLDDWFAAEREIVVRDTAVPESSAVMRAAYSPAPPERLGARASQRHAGRSSRSRQSRSSEGSLGGEHAR
jgi:Protein of unknown function (DUF2934)